MVVSEYLRKAAANTGPRPLKMLFAIWEARRLENEVAALLGVGDSVPFDRLSKLMSYMNGCRFWDNEDLLVAARWAGELELMRDGLRANAARGA